MPSHSHHEPFKALGSINWDKVASSDLESFLAQTFADAATVIDSIPVPETVTATTVSSPTSPDPSNGGSGGGRARSHTDSALRGVDIEGIRRAASVSQRQRQTGESMAQAQELRKEWSQLKVGAAGSRENPMGINVYKLSAKDGKGSWFARRSVHADLPFERWKLGLEREFPEAMKVQAGPGGGSIRGIGAERCVEHHVAEKVGKAEVFQLSAQFPGPTAPRDFITLLLTSDCSQDGPDAGSRLREFIVVSKPCIHPKCPPRQGYIRGQYESVEIIREIPIAVPEIKRTRSSIDLTHDGQDKSQHADNMTKDAVLRAARQQNAGVPGLDDSDTRSETAVEVERVPVAIEWIMVTRSDPGGSVPRFMIEKGTPGAIVADAGKFVKWLTSKAVQEEKRKSMDHRPSGTSREPAGQNQHVELPSRSSTIPEDDARSDTSSQPSEHPPSSNGLYGMIASAIGTAGSVASRLPNPFSIAYSGSFGPPQNDQEMEGNDDDDDDTISDASSILSFASARETTSHIEPAPTPDLGSHRSDSSSTIQKALSRQSGSEGSEKTLPINGAAPAHATKSSHEKEIRRLEERRRKLQEKIGKMQDRMANKRQEDREKDAAAIARLREKHDREIAKQEERYRREMRKLEEKREADQRKAEEKRRKNTEREERNKLSVEVERLTTERDLARKEAELLREQVGNLQRENTMLVAQLGRAGILPRPTPGLSRSVTEAKDDDKDGDENQPAYK